MGALEFESRANAIRGGDPGGARRPSRGGIRDKPIHNVSEVPFSRGSFLGAIYMAVSCGSVPTRISVGCSACAFTRQRRTTLSNAATLPKPSSSLR
jgi:hypothetical protein